jgi:phytoene desaturase
MPSTLTSSIAVVGAGPGGLATALLLAGSGLPVTIYEAAPTVGGRTSRITLRGTSGGDYTFDRGPTFFLMPYVLEEIFTAAGRRLSDYVELTRLDPMYRLVLGRPGADPVCLDTTQDLDAMTERLAQIDPRDARAFRAFIAENRRKLDIFTPILRKPFRSARDLIDPKLLKALPVLKPTRSVHAYLGSHFRNPLVKLALSFQSKYLGMSPFHCPSLFSILPFIEYEYGIWHVTGGLNRLMSGMATAAAELGVRIHCGAPVERIEFDGRRAIGVRVGSELKRHDQVVVNADAPWAMKHLIPEPVRAPGGWTDRRLDSMRYSCSTYMLYLGLRTTLDLPHHTIVVSSDYERNIRQIAETGELSDEPSMYFCNPSPRDHTLAPAGHSSLYALVPVPNLERSRGRIDWSRDAGVLRRRVLDRLAQLTGSFREEAVDAQLQITPEDWRAANIQFGATFNLAHTLGQMLHRRPQHELPGMEGVWLAGGGTHPGSGLPVIFLSAQIAAERLCARLGVAYAGHRPPGQDRPRREHRTAALACT